MSGQEQLITNSIAQFNLCIDVKQTQTWFHWQVSRNRCSIPVIYLVNRARVSIAWESMLLRDGMGGHKNIQSHQLDPNYLAVSTPSKYASRSQVRQF